MPSIKLVILYLIFFLSGISGLVYESVWSQYVKLMLGHAAYAQSFVLAVFMGGMALGAFLVSRYTKNIRNPIRAYAVIEAIIGLFGVLFHSEFQLINDLVFSTILPGTSSALMAQFTKLSLSLLLLLPQAILLGSTFPLMSAGVIRLLPSTSGKAISTLYFSNSFGAAFGALFSGFVLINLFGLPGTTLTAGILNLLVALIALVISKQIEQISTSSADESCQTQETKTRQNAPIILFLGVAFTTGFASFLYEIGWIRMLTLVLGGSVHSFEIMLSAFILGLAIGSLWIRKKIDSIHNPRHFLGWIQLLMALMAVATLPLYTHSFEMMGQFYKSLSLTDQGYFLFNLGSMLICMLVMLPATILAGMTLPLITHILVKSKEGEKAIGKVYAANTVGAIAGIITATNILMPLVGVKYVVIFGGLCDFVIGVILLWKISNSNGLHTFPKFAVLVVAALFFSSSLTPFNRAVLGSGVYRSGQASLAEGTSTLFYQDGKTATISVIQDTFGNTSIQTNGKSDALIAPVHLGHSPDETTMVLLAALPLLFAENIQNIANIGFGSGLTTHVLLNHDNVKSINTIEIEQAMVDGARFFGDQVKKAFSDNRSHIHIDDAKSFFSSTQSRYDVIISEPSNPWVSGIAFLFTEEFYKHIVDRLNEKGILAQWLQLYETDMKNVGSIMKALSSVFPYYQLYNTDDANMLILGFKQKPEDLTFNDLFSEPEFSSELNRIGVNTPQDLLLRYIGDSTLLAPAFEHMPAPKNSDYFPFLSYNAAKTRFKKDNALEITILHQSLIPLIKSSKAYTNPTGSSAHFSVYEFAARAKRLIAGEYSNLPEKLKFSALLVDQINNLCAEKELLEEPIIEALFTIAKSINPFLSDKQLARYWSELENKCKPKGKNQNITNWLAFYRELSLMNQGGILNKSNILLTNTTSVKTRELLISAKLNALLALNERAELEDLLIEEKLLENYSQLPFDLQVLISYSLGIEN